MIQRLIFSFTTLQYSRTPALQLNYTPKAHAPYHSLLIGYSSVNTQLTDMD